MALTTTLNRIKACNPCRYWWEQGLSAAGKSEPDDEPISYEAILDAVGLDRALWCCRVEPQYSSLWRQYAVHCARSVQHLMTDPRSIAALDVAERHANGDATDEELAAARAAAAAARSVADVDVTVRDAVWAARAASDAASDSDAAYSAAWSAWVASDATRDSQSAAFRQLVTTGTLPPVQPIQEAIQ